MTHLKPCTSVILVIAFTIFGSCAHQSWSSDIDRFETELEERHPDLFFQIPKKHYRQEVEKLRQSSDSLTPQQIVLKMARITAWMLNGRDSHTQIALLQNRYFSRLPLRLQWFGDALHVVGVHSKHKAALGKRVVKIGNMPVAEALKETKKYITHANDVWAKAMAASYLTSPELLLHIGATKDQKKATLWLEDKDKGTTSRTVEASDLKPDRYILPLGTNKVPLHLQSSTRKKNYWYAHLKEKKALYVHYYRCMEMESQSFEGFTKEVFAAADKHAVEKLILDMRHNSGGDSRLIWSLINKVKERPSLNKAKRFFVIIGSHTFSSAVFACIYLDNATEVTFIGEPTGGKPTKRYGDMSNSFELPYSGVKVSCAAKYFDLGSKWDVKDSPSFMPDVEVKSSYADYAALKDPVLEHIFKHY